MDLVLVLRLSCSIETKKERNVSVVKLRMCSASADNLRLHRSPLVLDERLTSNTALMLTLSDTDLCATHLLFTGFKGRTPMVRTHGSKHMAAILTI